MDSGGTVARSDGFAETLDCEYDVGKDSDSPDRECVDLCTEGKEMGCGRDGGECG